MSENPQLSSQLSAAISAEPLLANLTDFQRAALGRLVVMVNEMQQSLNLTAIRDQHAMVRYHLADSMALLPVLDSVGMPDVKVAVDIGTGGGFPLLPLAIVRGDIHWIGVESVQKKAAAAQKMGHLLELNNIELRAERAEDVARGELRDNVDLVTARAVGPIASLLEVGMPLLKSGGRICLFKTETARKEWDACTAIIERLGGIPSGEYKYTLEGDEQERVIFIAEKTAESPEDFPRRAGVPFRKPLAGKNV